MDDFTETGRLQNVHLRNIGSLLNDDYLTGDSVLEIADGSDFAEDGGDNVDIDGAVYTVVAVEYGELEDDPDLVTVSPALVADTEAGTAVDILPISQEMVGQVVFDNNTEAPVDVKIDWGLRNQIPEGVRDPEDRESVNIEIDDVGNYVVRSINGGQPILKTEALDQQPLTTDGLPPAETPAIQVLPGIGSLFIVWSPLDPAVIDPAVYDVHLYTVPDAVLDNSNLVTTTTGPQFQAFALADASPLVVGTEYYARIVARDTDGSAAPSNEASGSPLAGVDQSEIDALNTDVGTLNDNLTVAQGQIDTLNTTTIPGINAALATAQDDIDTLNTVTIPGINSTLADAQSDIDTLNTTTIPGINSTISDVQSDVDTINTTTIPGINSTISDNTSAINTLNTTTIPGINSTLSTANSNITALQGRFPVVTADIADNAITAVKIPDASLTTAKYGAGSVTTTVIADDSISSAKIIANSIVAADIAADTITASQLAANSITASELAANSITAADMLANTITAAQIAASTITTNEILANTILAADIAATTITGDRLVANTITAGQIAALTITAAQIAADTITASELAANSITASELAANSITAADMLANTVTAAQIAATTITAAQIAATTITGDRLVANTITASQIAADTITAAELAANSITASELAANSVTAADMLANTVTASQVAANTLTASQILAGSLTTATMTANTINGDRVTANTLAASKIVASSITASQIAGTTITASQIAGGTITATQIASGTITATQIAGTTITGDKIAAGAITATQIATGTITATQIAGGTITGSQLSATSIDGKTITGAIFQTVSGLGGTAASGMSMGNDLAGGVIKFYTGGFDLNGGATQSTSAAPGYINPGVTFSGAAPNIQPRPWLDIRSPAPATGFSGDQSRITLYAIDTRFGGSTGMTEIGSPTYFYGQIEVAGSIVGDGNLTGNRVFISNPDTTTGTTNIRRVSGNQLQLITSLTKHKVDPKPISLDRLKSLLDVPTVEWYDRAEYKANKNRKNGLRQYAGVLAEDVAAVEEVFADYMDDELVGVAYDRIGVALLPLVKDLYKRIDDLESRLATA